MLSVLLVEDGERLFYLHSSHRMHAEAESFSWVQPGRLKWSWSASLPVLPLLHPTREGHSNWSQWAALADSKLLPRGWICSVRDENVSGDYLRRHCRSLAKLHSQQAAACVLLRRCRLGRKMDFSIECLGNTNLHQSRCSTSIWQYVDMGCVHNGYRNRGHGSLEHEVRFHINKLFCNPSRAVMTEVLIIFLSRVSPWE